MPLLNADAVNASGLDAFPAVAVAVALVVRAIPRFVARSTKAVEQACGAVLERKLGHRFDYPTAAAAFLTLRAIHAIV